MQQLKNKEALGVIISRMQVPVLTEAHKALINTALERHNRILILLGCTGAVIDEKNPYPYEFRKQMIEQSFPNSKITFAPLPDVKGQDVLWVKLVDYMVETQLNKNEDAVLYGGRDSFIPLYINGKYACVELSAVENDSGTKLRSEAIKDVPKYTPEVANAILWAVNQIIK